MFAVKFFTKRIKMHIVLEELSETLGVTPESFQIGDEGIFLQNRNPRFYHENFFSSKDFHLVCEKHNLDGEIHFNSNNTLSFVMKTKSGTQK